MRPATGFKKAALVTWFPSVSVSALALASEGEGKVGEEEEETVRNTRSTLTATFSAI